MSNHYCPHVGVEIVCDSQHCRHFDTCGDRQVPIAPEPTERVAAEIADMPIEEFQANCEKLKWLSPDPLMAEFPITTGKKLIAAVRTVWLCVFYFYVCFILLDMRFQQDTLAVKNKLLRYAAYRANLDNERLTWTRQEADRLAWYWQQTRLQHREWTTVVETVLECSRKYRIRPELGMAIIHRESYFDSQALSVAGAYGLMQVRLSVWGESLGLTVENITDIKTNIDAGFKILRQYLDEAGGDEVKALTWYNCGYSLSNPRYIPRLQSSKFFQGK